MYVQGTLPSESTAAKAPYVEQICFTSLRGGPHLSSVFLVVKPSKTIFLIENTIPQKEDIILLYIGYHSIPKLNTTHLGATLFRVVLKGPKDLSIQY